jgi:hypothetical protein
MDASSPDALARSVKAHDANCEQREDGSHVASVRRGGVRRARARAPGREEQRRLTVSKM